MEASLEQQDSKIASKEAYFAILLKKGCQVLQGCSERKRACIQASCIHVFDKLLW